MVAAGRATQPQAARHPAPARIPLAARASTTHVRCPTHFRPTATHFRCDSRGAVVPVGLMSSPASPAAGDPTAILPRQKDPTRRLQQCEELYRTILDSL